MWYYFYNGGQGCARLGFSLASQTTAEVEIIKSKTSVCQHELLIYNKTSSTTQRIFFIASLVWENRKIRDIIQTQKFLRLLSHSVFFLNQEQVACKSIFTGGYTVKIVWKGNNSCEGCAMYRCEVIWQVLFIQFPN